MPSIALVLLAIVVAETGNVGLALLFVVADAAILTLALAIRVGSRCSARWRSARWSSSTGGVAPATADTFR
jgi:hypothetical protein